MKKKGLVLVIALLCMASLLAAMAYTSAEVKASYTIKVADSDKALLALSFNPSAATGDCTGVMENGNLAITFGKGAYGLQPDSKYVWEDLVTVKNNSTNRIKVTITELDETKDRLIIKSGDTTLLGGTGGTGSIIIAVNGIANLTFEVTVPAGAATGAEHALTGDIFISAVAID